MCVRNHSQIMNTDDLHLEDKNKKTLFFTHIRYKFRTTIAVSVTPIKFKISERNSGTCGPILTRLLLADS